MKNQLSHVVAAIYNQPWFIQEAVLEQIASIVTFHVDGGSLSREEIQERLDVAAARSGPRGGARNVGNVAVIPIYGSIVPRASLFSDFSGGTSVGSIRESFRAAMADESIGSILFDIDSPGGRADGIEELATEIREARGVKPMASIADYTMASAALYLGVQADEVIASPSSVVGWIGTVMVHQELSRAYEEAGITNTIVRNPPGKFGANSYEPLSEAARTELQQTIDDYSNQFFAAVAKGRGVPLATVKADFGAGGGMTAARAKAAGLVDRVDTFDGAARRLLEGRVKPRTGDTQATMTIAAEDLEPASKLASATDDDVDEISLERAIAARRRGA